MPTPSEYFPLPLDLLIGRLEAAGFRVDTSRRLRMLRVFDDLGNPFVDRHFEELKYLLSPLVSRSPQEQERFYEIFDAFWRECEAEVEQLEAGGAFAEKEKVLDAPKAAAKKSKVRHRWWISAGLAATALFVLVCLTLTHQAMLPLSGIPTSITEGDTLRATDVVEITPHSIFGIQLPAIPPKVSVHWEVKDSTKQTTLHHDTGGLAWRVTEEQGQDIWIFQKTTATILFREDIQHDTFRIKILCSNPPEASKILPSAQPPYQPDTKYEFSIQTEPGCGVVWNFGGLEKRDTADARGQSTIEVETEASNADVLVINLMATIQRAEKAGYCSTSRVFEIQMGNKKPILPLAEFQRDHTFTVLTISRLGWLLILLPLLPALWFFWRWWKKRHTSPPQKTPEELAAQYPITDAGPYFIPYLPQEHNITVPRQFFRIAEVLRRREEGHRRYFDGPATVRATVESGGFPAWRERAVTRPAEYLFLVERSDERDQQGKLFARLCDFLKRRDVPLTTFYHDGSFGHFWSADQPNGLPPAELRRRYPHHRLVLLGAAHGLVNPYATQQPELLRAPLDWLTHWQRRLLLTPDPVAAWSFQEALLHRHFLVFPADTEGILSGIDLLDRTEEYQPGRFERWQDTRAPRHSRENHRYRTWKTAADHADYLHDDPDCYRWLCALAVCAQPDWPLTLAAGRAIGVEVTHDRLLLLTRIPWLSQNLPNDGLRLDLLRQLSPADELAARNSVARELEAVRSLTANSFADTERTANTALQNFALDPRDEAHKQAIRELRTLGLLSGSQEAELDFIVQEKADKRGLPNSAGADIASWLEVPAPKQFWTKDMNRGLLSALLSFIILVVLFLLSARETPLSAPFDVLLKNVAQDNELMQMNERAIGIAQRALAVENDDQWRGLQDSVRLADSLFQQVASMGMISVSGGLTQLAQHENNLGINLPIFRYNVAAKNFNFYQTGDLSGEVLRQPLRNFGWVADAARRTSATEDTMKVFIRKFEVDAQHGEGLCHYYLSKYLASRTLPTRAEKSPAVLDSIVREQKMQLDTARLIYERISNNLLVPNYFEDIGGQMPVNLETLLDAERVVVVEKSDPVNVSEEIAQKMVGYWFYEKKGSAKAINIFRKDGTAAMLAYNWENKLEQTGAGKWSVENKTLRLVQEGEITTSKITYLDNNRLTLDDGTTLTLTFRRIQSTDRDGDGVLDVVDNCPDEKGWAEKAGCPAEKSPAEEITGPTVAVSAVNKLTNDPLYEVTYRLIEIGGKDVQEKTSAQDEGRVSFEVNGSRYKIVASKPNWHSDSTELNTASRQTNPTFTKILSLQPVLPEVYIPPLVLYFDNDQPDRNSISITTKQEYQALYIHYIRKKEEFIRRHTAGLSKEAIAAATDSLETFFERDVRGGWDRLWELSDVLYEKLQRGDKIELTIHSYTAPRGSSAYNQKLSERRVSSVVNHFLSFDGGIYKEFVDSGQLVIKQQSYGESRAPKNVNDDEKDPRRAVYSLEAARENRVEIIVVEVKGKNKN